MRPTKAIINLSNIDSNIKELKKLTNPNTNFMAVVKANAYGHGAVNVAMQAIKSGAHSLGVAIPEEGAELRETGITEPILILGGIDDLQVKTVVDYGLTQCVFSEEIASRLNDEAQRQEKLINIHLKLDTGMNRIGIKDELELEAFIAKAKTLRNINIEGVFTHFASADEADKAFTYKQIDRFAKMLKIIKQSNVYPKWIHAANSAAILNYPESHFNLVRAGISIYGYYPSNIVNKNRIKLLPAMQLETKIVSIREIEHGESISYGRTFIAHSPMRVATLPLGYADGYRRLLSNKGHVLVAGVKAAVIGRICMDQLMVDISHLPQAKLNDPVTLIGIQENESVDANYLADLCETISYEILTSISSRVARIYVESEKTGLHDE